ncbi:LuxR C-terminal-related transcriptional regulator [Chryseobacterium sp. ISL-6]|uniref:response regulator transcription factor n=1 Tax=Chryseobacterium sp. ISL-6 TaxID=2819143 RepID=UPI001BEC23F6|nr:LuxR C-terminal-related transcriptional regulator [Chryseobacterium sp. ISL-6]MBT2620073.1 response regulator transcription factor [Chryseobacterium sp. ISL-6]
MSSANPSINEILDQTFSGELDPKMSLEKYRHVAFIFSVLQNSTAILTDLKSQKNYIYHGALSEYLGIGERMTSEISDHLWKESVLNNIHPEDLKSKQTMELQLFHFLKNKPLDERLNYYLIMRIRVRAKNKEYVPLELKVFYASSQDSIQLVLYLYSFTSVNNQEISSSGTILDSSNGKTFSSTDFRLKNILSKREIEVLKEIASGSKSQRISEKLYISKNTVDRHRQNIIEKLNVKNSTEACHAATLMGII